MPEELKPTNTETESTRHTPQTHLWERHPRVVIAGLVAGTTLLLILALELSLRLIIDDVVYNSHRAMLREYFPEPEGIKLVDPAPWLTDEHGIFVANPKVMLDVNSKGYRTPKFDGPDNELVNVLFLGDSFTWGWTAEPISACFVDLVREAGYSAINLGVPGSAPVQYVTQAELYIPQLKPDVVVVMFYPGDDFSRSAPVIPGLKRWHVTDQIFLNAGDAKGNPITYEEARREYLSFFGNNLRARLRRACMSTATGSFVAKSLVEANEPDRKVYQQLATIRDVSEEHDAIFMLFLLPVRPAYRTPFNSSERSAELFAEMGPYVPDSLSPEHYAPLPDAHFNNVGHLAVAKLILEQLEAAGFQSSASGSAHVERVSVEDAVKIIQNYTALLPKAGANGSVVVDSSLLPLPKERITAAAITLMAVATDPAEQKGFGELAKSLAFFQPDVGDTPISLDEIRSDGGSWRSIIELDMQNIELLFFNSRR